MGQIKEESEDAMNWNVATLEQCRDFLAECKGWRKHLDHWHDDREGMEGLAHVQHSDHPIPATIDSIAASLPEGWRSNVLGDSSNGDLSKHGVTVTAWNPSDFPHGDVVSAFVLHGRGDELLARARCACLAWEAMGK